MPHFIACKLPHGLTIKHKGKSLTLIGANVGEDLEQVSKNGRPNDNANRVGGFGITKLNDLSGALEFYNDWAAAVTFVDGKPAKGKLAEPFPALQNGSILGPFDTIEELRRECGDLSAAIVTGTEGLDPEAEAKAATTKNPNAIVVTEDKDPK